jgi:ribosomal protein S1
MELTGTVRSIQTYGAFVDIGVGRDGLVHISELKDGFVEKVEDVVKPGDPVTVRIKDVDQNQGRISLSMRPPRQERERAPARPREGGEEQARRPRAERPAEGGADEMPQATLEGGESGDDQRPRSERLRQERFRDERLLEEKRRLRLRDLNEGQEFSGRVTSIVDFGAFIDIGASTDGLVHISELSDDRVNKVTDVIQEGQEVKVRILQVDRKRNRISLTMREPQQLEMPEDEDDTPLPTLFEAAFQRASERAQKKERRQEAKKAAAAQQDALNEIIRRTLEQHRSS